MSRSRHWNDAEAFRPVRRSDFGKQVDRSLRRYKNQSWSNRNDELDEDEELDTYERTTKRKNGKRR